MKKITLSGWAFSAIMVGSLIVGILLTILFIIKIDDIKPSFPENGYVMEIMYYKKGDQQVKYIVCDSIPENAVTMLVEL